jgi:hypothetical protein
MKYSHNKESQNAISVAKYTMEYIELRIMNRYISLGVICLLLLFLMIGVCMADETPSYLGYVQGGGSSITDGANGTYMITVNDVNPYFHLADGNKSTLIPVKQLTNMTYPMNAAMVFSGTDNETTFMADISNISLSDGNKVLKLQAHPISFYDGMTLRDFANVAIPLDQNYLNKPGSISFYLEIKRSSPTNDVPSEWKNEWIHHNP